MTAVHRSGGIRRWGVACLGETLVDMVPLRGGDLNGAGVFLMAAGGAPANVAVGVARLGFPSAFLGAVGVDPLGTFLLESLQGQGVETKGMIRVAHRETALALVSLSRDGDREFSFYGARPAHLGLRLTPRMHSVIRHSAIFHYGSITLVANPGRVATLMALREARRLRRLCSYDPNLRLNLWPDVRSARRWVRSGLQLADCVKVNEEELRFLTAQGDVGRGLQTLVQKDGLQLAVATLGSKGCAYCTPAYEGRLPGFHARTVDTTGAGDAFVAAMLARLLALGADLQHRLPNRRALEAALTFANAAAALSTQRRGAIRSLATKRQVLAFLRNQRVELTDPV